MKGQYIIAIIGVSLLASMAITGVVWIWIPENEYVVKTFFSLLLLTFCDLALFKANE